jgi:hypothetical protein
VVVYRGRDYGYAFLGLGLLGLAVGWAMKASGE